MLSGALKQLYPHDRSTGRDLLICILTGFFITLFLIVFRPFGINNWNAPFLNLKIAGYGVVTALILLTRYFVIPKLFRNFEKSETWTLGLELGTTFITISVIAIVNFYYLNLIVPVSVSHINFINMATYTFLLGIFPVSTLICLNYILQLNKYLALASVLTVHRQLNEKNCEGIWFTAENGLDKINLHLEDLVYIEAEDNYCGVNHYQDGILEKRLLRNTLTHLQNQLHEHALVRCHRSFMINLNQVKKVIGNAQGYRFCIRASTLQVPVGRKYNQVVGQFKSVFIAKTSGSVFEKSGW